MSATNGKLRGLRTAVSINMSCEISKTFDIVLVYLTFTKLVELVRASFGGNALKSVRRLKLKEIKVAVGRRLTFSVEHEIWSFRRFAENGKFKVQKFKTHLQSHICSLNAVVSCQ